MPSIYIKNMHEVFAVNHSFGKSSSKSTYAGYDCVCST